MSPIIVLSLIPVPLCHVHTILRPKLLLKFKVYVQVNSIKVMLWKIAKLKSILTKKHLESAVNTFITFCLDYPNPSLVVKDSLSPSSCSRMWLPVFCPVWVEDVRSLHWCPFTSEYTVYRAGASHLGAPSTNVLWCFLKISA